MINKVFNLANEVMITEPFYVKVDMEAIKKLADDMIEAGKVVFFSDDSIAEKQKNTYHVVIKELIASSINYCYWYGSYNIRPNGVSSTTMYKAVDEAFGDGTNALMFENRINDLIRILSVNRYPLLEERKRHLLDLVEDRKAEEFAAMVVSKEYNGEELLHKMVEMFSGFASDIFLKRAALFFMQLHRHFGWYENLMSKIFVPADYQVPKLLRHFNCIIYNDLLADEVDNCILIKKHSLKEIQIRAATIKVCKQLQNLTGWNAVEIDTYLWTKRKSTDKPFHLTVTSDY